MVNAIKMGVGETKQKQTNSTRKEEGHALCHILLLSLLFSLSRSSCPLLLQLLSISLFSLSSTQKEFIFILPLLFSRFLISI
ncbi:unnamed protein product, partial [Brassica oleracea]